MDKSYLKIVLNQLPRLLGFLDKCPISDSYGCFDRKYWKYKTNNFNDARLQEAAFTLCLLFFKKSDENPYYKNNKIKELSIAACDYWSKIQNRDGSFDEYITYEKSHVATAFSSYCIAYCYYLFNLDNKKILASLKKSADWLNVNDDLEVTNHDAASIPFFCIMNMVTKDKKYLTYLNIKLKKVLNNQDEEGWFKEYGGADIGYQSYTIYYLAKYYSLSKDKSILNPLEKAIQFFNYFIHPDGTIGGEYGSRATDFILPAGFEILKNEISLAYTISKKIKEAVISKKITGPNSLDDKFIAEELYTYLDFDEKQEISTKSTILSYEVKDFKKIFKNAGISVIKSGEHYLIVNMVKGGLGKIFVKNKLQKKLLPYVFKEKKSIYSTYGPSIFNIQKDYILIEGRFYIYQTRFQTFPLSIILEIVNRFGGGKILKNLIRKKLIHEKRKSNYSFRRLIELKDSKICIKDTFEGLDKNLPKLSDYSPIYSTSTQFL